MSVAKTILQNLFYEEKFARKVLPYIKSEYFKEQSDQVLFDIYFDYVIKYNAFPSIKALAVELSEKNIDQEIFDECKEFLIDSSEPPNDKFEWLIDISEEFCQDRAIELALQKSLAILDGKDKKLSKNHIPTLLQEAINVTFNTRIGTDFIEDAEERFERYNESVSYLPFHLDHLNKLLRGGLRPGTLSIVMAGTGVGKSIFLCDCAANHLLNGKNVLYITLELSEDMISERIEANLLDINIEEVKKTHKSTYLSGIDRIKRKTPGKLIVQNYPTATAGAHHFRVLLEELRVKKNFIPDVIYIDYLNICISSRFTNGNQNSYSIVKSIAEEIRGLAVEYNVPIVSATQTTRGGYSSSELNLDDTAESWGLPQTADFFIALITNEEMEKLGQVIIRHLKNRWNDTNFRKNWLIGLDKKKMRFYDLEASAQDSLIKDVIDDDGDSSKPLAKLKASKKKPKQNFDKFNREKT